MIKTLPKAETIWETIVLENGKTYIITSTKLRDKYFLYEAQGTDKYKKLGQAAIPTTLRKKYLGDEFE